jgi:hypothetical protein
LCFGRVAGKGNQGRIMSKLVNWGHWLITLFLGVLGVWFLAESVRELPQFMKFLRQARSAGGDFEFGWDLGIGFVAWAPTLLCAWGVHKWWRWGQVLTIVLCGLTLLFYAQGLAFFGRSFLSFQSVSTLLTAALIILWLLLPPVRQRFHV